MRTEPNELVTTQSKASIACWAEYNNTTTFYEERFDNISQKNVQIIYEGLPVLVDGLLGEYPDLNRLLEPIFAAAKVFPS